MVPIRSSMVKIGLCAVIAAVLLTSGIVMLTSTNNSDDAGPGFGVTLPDAPNNWAELAALAAAVGRAPSTVMWYEQWSSSPDFPAAGAATVAAAGAVPEITWEPWDPTKGMDQPGYSLASITLGDHDGYLRRWAAEIKRYGAPVRLRFAHEMNGDWYPWSEGVNGNAFGAYVAAWRHVHDVFRSVGASNVIWVWSPNVSYPGSMKLAEVYPGDADVDEVAVDGYNWSELRSGSAWRSFTDIFDPTLAELAPLTHRPVSVGEVASTELGGDKADWITGMFAAIAQSHLTGFTWFDWDKETDWRVASSPTALAAFREGLRDYRSPVDADCRAVLRFP